MNRYQQAMAPTHTELAGIGLERDASVVLISGAITNGGVVQNERQGIQDGGDLYVFPESAQRLDVSSDSIVDTVGGIGGSEILIEGLDSDYRQITELVSLSGLTTVQTTQAFLRVNDAAVTQAGSTGFLQGNVTVTTEITADRLAYLDAISGRSNTGNYTVPADHDLLIRDIFTSVSRKDEVEAFYTQRDFNSTAFVSTPAGILYESFGAVVNLDIGIRQKTDLMLTMHPFVADPKIVFNIAATLYNTYKLT